jgi:glucose-1-phosphate adenylyltransferase
MPCWCLLLPAAIILGGGAGSRLFPLTKTRAKPAVPIGGAYRLIDVPMSNCINSGISKIYILTQFNSTSLNRHLGRAYNMGSGVRFGGDGFVEVGPRCSLLLPCHAAQPARSHRLRLAQHG